MRKLLTKRKRRGSTTIIAVAVTFAILIFFWMFMELQQFFDAQYNVEVRCQRAVNACLEYFMDDRLRADGYNCLCVEDGTTRHADKIYTIQYADQNGKGLYSYLDNTLGITDWSGSKIDGGARYRKDSTGETLFTVTYSNREYKKGFDGVNNRGEVASISVDVTVQLNTGLARYMGITGSNGFSWTQTFKSTNFRTDGNERG